MPRPIERKTALRIRQGNRIREHRKFRKLTQEQVADFVGVTKTAVSLWEKGSTSPADIHQIALARALETPWHILFGLDGEDVA